MELLTPREFVVVSLLVNRGELRYGEIRDAARGEMPLGTVSGTVTVLTQRGLLAKSRERQPDGTWQAAYRVTEHGRNAATDFVDWVLCTAKGVKPERRSADAQAPRLPTADERRELLAAANPRLGRLLRFVWAMPEVGVPELAEADVGDFDRDASELTVGPRERNSSKSRRPPRRRVTLTPEAAAIAAEAAGLRTSGVLFPAHRGGRFQRQSVNLEFQYLRQRCGIPAHVKMRLRPGGRPVHAERDGLFLAWYEDRGAATFHSPATIRRRWDPEHPDDPIPTGDYRNDYVTKAIGRARKQRDAERSATSPAA